MIYSITASHNGIDYPIHTFYYYPKREAIARYKEMFGLKGKHNVIINL